MTRAEPFRAVDGHGGRERGDRGLRGARWSGAAERVTGMRDTRKADRAGERVQQWRLDAAQQRGEEGQEQARRQRDALIVERS